MEEDMPKSQEKSEEKGNWRESSTERKRGAVLPEEFYRDRLKKNQAYHG